MVPHTTALRGSQYEIVVNATFLKPGAFLVQGVTSVPRPFALHRLGVLRQQAFDQVSDGLLRWLGY
jgi:mRNA interferase MazF